MKAGVDLRAAFAKAGTVSSENGSKKCRDADGSNHVSQCLGGPHRGSCCRCSGWEIIGRQGQERLER